MKYVTLIMFVAALPLAVSGQSSERATLTVDDLDAVLSVKVNRSDNSQTILIDNRYRLEVRDETEDGMPDTWTLYEHNRIRCKRWARYGIGPADDGQLYDDNGASIGVVLMGDYHSREDEAEAIRRAMEAEIEGNN